MSISNNKRHEVSSALLVLNNHLLHRSPKSTDGSSLRFI